MPVWIHYVETSIDSFLICGAWRAWRGRGGLAFAALCFGLFDAAATWAASCGASGVLAYAGLTFMAWLTAGKLRSELRALLGLSAVLGIDNLLLGVQESNAASAGLVSAVLAVLGFGAAALLSKLVPRGFQGLASLLVAIFCITSFSLN